MQAANARSVADAVDGQDLLAATQSRGQDGAAVYRPAVDEHRAGAALSAIAAQIGARQVQAEGHCLPQALAYVDDHRSGHAVDVQVDAAHAERQRAWLLLWLWLWLGLGLGLGLGGRWRHRLGDDRGRSAWRTDDGGRLGLRRGSRRHGDAPRDHRTDGQACPRACHEFAAGNDRPQML